MYCAACGKEMESGAKFCPACGAAGPDGAAPALQPGIAKGKSKIAAGVLGILVGWLGVHNFYLGYTIKAVIQLLLSLLALPLMLVCVGYFMWLAVWIWSLIEGIMILTGAINVDGSGKPLSD
jgi:TM2 domain-containing membrane protein YozV